MLFNSIGLKNFKCFEEVNIEFAPITLLTGANSSGKSSLINAILGIMQSRYFPQYFALNGKLVNMGGFDEVLWKGKKNTSLEVALDTDYLGKNNKYKTVWTEDTSSQNHYLSFISFENDKGYSFQKHLIELNNNSIANERVSLDFDDLEYFNYIGSYRLPPERTYYRKPNAKLVDINGEGYIDQIIDWEENDEYKFKELINALKDIGLFHKIKSSKIRGGRFEINVKIAENSPFSSLADVGFGISQFLPVIVADLQLDYGGCLISSQPEIHLHPKIQANLANYFMNQIHHTQKQYIIETHSEYLINRIRLLLVKGELKPEEVRLYYMENDGKKTTTYNIELTTDGQIKNAPQGFFDTYEMDVMDIALAATEI